MIHRASQCQQEQVTSFHPSASLRLLGPMEGTLFKWTNYYNGWQLRYFVLNEKGVLSYYKSRELLHEGCKGSCLVLACEVKVHPNDSLRFDLIIPGEQFFCLKAKSQSERQRWIVALGTSKSRGMTSTQSVSLSEEKTVPLVSHLSAIDHELKLKVQELRLYESVLMQRVHALKSIVNDKATPDVTKLDESTSMLTITCDGFIQTLDQCVQLATGHSSQSTLHYERNSSEEIQSIVLAKEPIYQTFFSKLSRTFSQFNSAALAEISSQTFLSTSEEYLHLIDLFHSSAFLPIRRDIDQNILKLRQSIPAASNKSLLSLINEQNAAFLSLQRMLKFLADFLLEFSRGEKSVEEALNKAYGQTLKASHQWNEREIFSIAFQSVPSSEEFLRSLSLHSVDAQQILFERQIFNEMIEHATHIFRFLQRISSPSVSIHH